MNATKGIAFTLPSSQQSRGKRPAHKRLWLRALVPLSGLLINEIPWYHSLGLWADLLLPIVAFFVTVSGATWLIIGFLRHSSERQLSELSAQSLNIAPVNHLDRAISRKPHRVLFPVSLVSVPLTVVFGVFYLTMQYVQTGADRVGQCQGINEAAAATDLILQSVVLPPRSAVSCGNERYGMFLSFYNDVTVYGVTSPAAQDRVLRSLADYQKQEHTLPMRVSFYEKENWIEHPGKNGASWGSAAPRS